MGIAHKILDGPTIDCGDLHIRIEVDLIVTPKAIPNKGDPVIFSDGAYMTKVGNASFGFIMKLNDVIVDASAIQGPKVASSKEAETRAVLATWEKARSNGFVRARVFTNYREVVQALKGDIDWSINHIFSDTKALAFSFYFVDLTYIPMSLNEEAHILAKFCYLYGQDVGWERALSSSRVSVFYCIHLILFPYNELLF